MYQCFEQNTMQFLKLTSLSLSPCAMVHSGKECYNLLVAVEKETLNRIGVAFHLTSIRICTSSFRGSLLAKINSNNYVEISVYLAKIFEGKEKEELLGG
jgi:hypothetical protein